ncbi:HugZ family protein [Hoeflea olei]|uniref:Pyridoxamine 5'-phosphate oxidase n=1 Tax=Hoeflea olei TaxID=1480615 RepID=A0A1C1Z0H7_9HYPH|nr:pyridoxamine 5'-phosphate oxidase family protein [Hoeflea olei]OCW59190.1 pyridoxamine 5'-phosphate oxidase [Hoeflea olei]
MKEPVKTIRDTDDAARRLARKLIRGARYGAISVIEPGTGFPFASRVLTGLDIDGAPVILISGLSVHTDALNADPRASLLFGEPGKGDPLAHPRITVRARAERVPRDGPVHARLRARFIARHPKAALYVDFPDFAFFRMIPQSANMNGGFGKAYLLEAADLKIDSPAIEDVAQIERSVIAMINDDQPGTADRYAKALGKSKKTGWVVCGVDCAGLDLTNLDELLRIEFDSAVSQVSELRGKLAELSEATGKNRGVHKTFFG